jgi:hypothetical protein
VRYTLSPSGKRIAEFDGRAGAVRLAVSHSLRSNHFVLVVRNVTVYRFSHTKHSLDISLDIGEAGRSHRRLL